MPDTRASVQAAIQLRSAGQRAKAEETLRRALRHDPAHPGANQLLAVLLSEAGRYDQALYFIQRSIAAVPDFAEFYVTLATIKSNTADQDGTVAALRRAIEIEPTHAGALSMLASLLVDRAQPSEAEALARRAMAMRRDPRGAYSLARALLETTQAAEALAVASDALRARPGEPELLSLACMLSNYAGMDRARAADLHRTYGRALGPPPPTMPARNPDPRRLLRVAMISPDFRGHSVASFLEPFLRSHDRESFQVVLVHTNPVTDPVTRRLRSCAAEFIHVNSPTDAAIAEALRACAPDLLIELSGHTAGHNLPLLARRMAPIQASYIGYPNTTGVPAIDYRIVDAITDPPGSESFCTERLARLPGCFLCYQPPSDAPPPLHGRAAGRPFTFGSFNNPAKLSPETLRVWAAVLRGAPASRLILKGRALADAGVRARVSAAFAGQGIEPLRVETLPMNADQRDHLALYHRIDLALDTFPYCGTTTTCEALFMGVPVLTRSGPTHASRVGSSLLTAAGLSGSGLITETADAYVARAVALATDPAALGALVADLRARLLSSPLCDAAVHTRALESALRAMWADLVTRG